MTDVDPEATVTSIDGVGAYDLISRIAMLENLRRMENGDQILLSARCFYGRPSTYLWEDEMGATQIIQQGEGGEQGDPLVVTSSQFADPTESALCSQFYSRLQSHAHICTWKNAGLEPGRSGTSASLPKDSVVERLASCVAAFVDVRFPGRISG